MSFPSHYLFFVLQKTKISCNSLFFTLFSFLSWLFCLANEKHQYRKSSNLLLFLATLSTKMKNGKKGMKSSKGTVSGIASVLKMLRIVLKMGQFLLQNLQIPLDHFCYLIHSTKKRRRIKACSMLSATMANHQLSNDQFHD